MVNQEITFHFQPIVILGAPRSGTNLLRDALCSQQQVATWPCDEINLLWRHGNIRKPTDELTRADARPHVRRRLRQAFCSLANQYQANWVVEKTCANSLRVDFVDQVLPEAKYLYITRNGVDATASAMKRWRAPLDWKYTLKKIRYAPLADLPYYALGFMRNRLERFRTEERRVGSWGPRFSGLDKLLETVSLAEVCAQQWRACVQSTQQSIETISAERVHHLRYEDLVTNPATSIEQACQFLRMTPDADRIRTFCQGVYASSLGAGARELSENDLQAIEPIIESISLPANHEQAA